MWIVLEKGEPVRAGDERAFVGIKDEGEGRLCMMWKPVAESDYGRPVGDACVRRMVNGWAAVCESVWREILPDNALSCQTSALAWECECAAADINLHADKICECPACGSRRGDGPDARKGELLLAIIGNTINGV